MLFPHAFWGGLDMFGRVAPAVGQRGEFFLFYSYATISGGALLAALVAGDAADDFESADPKESAAEVLRVLRGMYGPKGVNVPAPLQVCHTQFAFSRRMIDFANALVGELLLLAHQHGTPFSSTYNAAL